MGAVNQHDLDRAVKNLKEHIDTKFQAQKEYDQQVHEAIKTDVSGHSKLLYGNGENPGLKLKVDRMETGYKIIKRIALGITGLFSIIGTYLGLKFK